MSHTSRRTVAVAAAALSLPAAVVGLTAAADGDADAPITGDALSQAGEAALAETGGGSVTETEVGDEESYYEVEVTLADGSAVDVQLDRSFAVVGQEADGSGEDD